MTAFIKLVLVSVVLIFGCKTRNSTSSTRDAKNVSDSTKESFKIDNLNHSIWASTFDGGSLNVKLNISFDSEGRGTITSSSKDETIEKAFKTTHMADENELKRAYKLFGSNTFSDTNGREILFTEALVLVDESGESVHILPVLHENELFIFPLGSVIRQ